MDKSKYENTRPASSNRILEYKPQPINPKLLINEEHKKSILGNILSTISESYIGMLSASDYNTIDLGLTDRVPKAKIYKELQQIAELKEKRYIAESQSQQLVEQSITQLLREIQFTETKEELLQDLHEVGELAENGLFSKVQHQLIVEAIMEKINAF